MTPGDYVVFNTGNFPSAAFWIKLGTFSRWNHAAILDRMNGEWTVIEANPGGVRVSPLSNYAPGTYLVSSLDLTAWQRQKVLDYAAHAIGTPYGWFDIAALALVALGVRPQWLDDYARRDDRLVCSQLVANAYDFAGVRLGDADPWTVTPGDLAEFLIPKGDHNA